MKISSYRYEVTKVQQEKMILDSFVRQVPEIRTLLSITKFQFFYSWLAACEVAPRRGLLVHLGQPSPVHHLTDIFGST